MTLTRTKPMRATTFDWSKVDVRGPDECWPWKLSLTTWGYGLCRYGLKSVNASRAAYLVEHGQIADGLVVCHRCDNPACCNPAHLFAATQAENLADCRRKGRARGTFCVGAKHPRHTAKLSPEQIEEARRLYADGTTQTEIARQMGVDSSTMSRAIRGLSRKAAA